MSGQDLESNYRQITANRGVAGDDFPKGVIDYRFSIGGNTAFHPSKSYFRVGLTVTGKNKTQPEFIM